MSLNKKFQSRHLQQQKQLGWYLLWLNRVLFNHYYQYIFPAYYCRGRLRPNIRPLRPGLRLNFGGKGSSTAAAPVPSTTQAPILESSSDEVEEKVCIKIYF